MPPLAVGFDVGEEVAGCVQQVGAGGDVPQAAVGVQFVHAPGGDQFQRVSVGRLLQRCLLYTSPSPRDRTRSRMPSSA